MEIGFIAYKYMSMHAMHFLRFGGVDQRSLVATSTMVHTKVGTYMHVSICPWVYIIEMENLGCLPHAIFAWWRSYLPCCD